MCDCAFHDANVRNGICTCLCDDHDDYFDSGVVVLRKEARSVNERLYALQQDMGQAHEAIGAYSKVASWHLLRLRGIEDELKRVNERLSPFEKVRADLEAGGSHADRARRRPGRFPLTSGTSSVCGGQPSGMTERLMWEADTQMGRLSRAQGPSPR